MRKIANFIIFQAAWFASVLGAANAMPWLGVIAVPVALGAHLALSSSRKAELLLALCSGAIGFTIDSGLISAGAFSPIPFIFPRPFSSLWMVMLWVNLATTLSVSMGWLRGRYVRAALFGGIGGPVAYYSGAKLGAMTAMPDLPGFLGIGLAWAIALPLLYGLRDLLYRRFPDPLKPGCE
jgi:hypothetical protein